MRAPGRFALTTASLLGSILWTGAAKAATLYFDAAGGNQNWDQLTTAAWSAVSGGPYNLTWGAGLGTDAVFEGTGGSVTIQALAPASVTSLAFGTSGAQPYTVSGAALNLAPAATITTTTNASISSAITGAVTSLMKNGAGTLTFDGAKTYTGATTVAAGQLVLNNASGFVSATTVNSGATLTFTGTSSVSAAAPVTLNDGARLENINPSAATTLTGAVTASGNTSITVNQTSGGGRGLILDGGLKGSGTVTINAVNAGNAVSLRNNNSTFAGTLVINGIASSAAGAGSGLALGGAATSNALINANVVLNGTIELADQGMGWANLWFTSVFNIGALSGTGIMVANRNPTGNFGSTIVLGHTNDDGLFSGRIMRGSGRTNTVGVTKVGTGTQIFSGANTYTGATNVNVGVLNIRHNTALGTTAGGTRVASGAALQIEGDIAVGAEALTLNGTGIANDGALRNMSGTNSYAGPITLGSAVRINSDAGMLTLGTITGATQNLTLGGAGGSTITGDVGITSGTLTKDGSGTAILSGTNTYTGATNIQGGTLQAGAAAGGRAFGTLSAVTLADVAGATLDLNGFSQTIGSLSGGGAAGGNVTLGSATLTTGGNDAHATFGGAISGTGAVVKVGPGTQTLTGASTYSGGTTITAGTLQLGDGGATGSIVGPVLNNAALVVNRSNEASLAGPISGSGSVTQSGSGTTVLSGANTYLGATTVANGALYIDGNQSAATGTTSVAAGATLGGRGTVGGHVALADGATLSPGGTGAAPGTLTINGDLSLASGSTLTYSFGQANVVGGAFNDLTQVGGNLRLGGTLNAVVSPGGAFDAGVYRVFSYGGTLDNQGLALGAMPSKSVFVQTSVANQVNLVATTGEPLNFWDGAAGPKNNAAVNGGDGVWQNVLGNDHWTEVSGVANAPFANGAYAVFMAQPGAVRVDNSLGQVNVSGMQFASDGYRVDGDGIALVGAQRTPVRVGDGSALGAGYTATINAVLSGTSSLEKLDLGTLVLGGANTYSGGTAVNGGVLQVAVDANLGAETGPLAFDGGTLRTTASFATARATTLDVGGGTLETPAGVALTHAGVISGAGALTKSGGGTVVLAGSNAYGGPTHVTAGTLRAGTAGAFSPASAHTVARGATLDTAGFNQRVASLDNGGTVSLVGAKAGSTLVVSGPYSARSLLRVGTGLAGGMPVSDRLVIDGAGFGASGHTTIEIATLGGLGAPTLGNGIEVISGINGATTTAQTTKGAFALANGHVDVGAYEYRLYAADLQGAGENWYLRTTAEPPPLPPLEGNAPPERPPQLPATQVPTYRAEVPLVAALPAQLRQADLAMLGNLHRRIGDEGHSGEQAAPALSEQRQVWARAVYADLDLQQQGIAHARSDGHVSGLQTGTDLWVHENWRSGLYVGYLEGKADVTGNARGANVQVGSNNVQSRFLGGYATWMDSSGRYLDSVLQGGSQRYQVRPDINPQVSGKATSFMASMEVGQPLAVHPRWSIEPQAQLIYQRINAADLTLAGASVTHDAASGWIGRLGMRVKGDLATAAGRLQPYGRANLYYADFDDDSVTFIGPAGTTTIVTAGGYSAGELAAGVTLALARGTSLYGEVGHLWSMGGDTSVKSSIQASLGIKVAW
ncbi:autotransporter outer membrane beta-barrel domain-containing protein [Variovorax soli]|uniref:autotransporter outer membrane beta-barrel domain-containing protein n=1 Tax=Variovorax soli TaxID=376815 RepID=UPI000A07AAB0|nr:autotransporter outer membrane beta-barrel domain-containing protein [Variovorax soli]